ncbi:TerB N-terminal domain-containing protein [Gimesia sp.]|uniref:tellurite resistance TerB family protein n=1 Tax=Gimesia sp. TaxID=2024833 RepID=UPI0032EFEF54
MSQTDTEMVFLKCGKCNRNLRVASTLSGRRVRCPKCKAPLQVPALDSSSDSENEYFPDWLKLIVALPIVLLFFGVMSIAIGKNLAIFLFLLTGGLTVLIWKREFVSSQIEKWQQESQIEASIKQKESQNKTKEIQKPVPEPRPSPTTNSEAAVDIDHLFEIQERSNSSTDVVRVSQTSQVKGIKKVSRWFSGPSEDDVVFYGPGSSSIVDDKLLDSALIYFVSGTLNQPYDSSLIETGLPVAKSGRGAYQLPYWPSYRQCSPEQRRNYLNWLTSGRRDPFVELGYVFIYFYGLERRIVVDRQDSLAVIKELLRLFPIYKSSRSFQRYCSSLLWMSALLASDVRELTDEILKQIIDATEFWSEANLSALLSIYQKQNLPLPPDVAFLVTEHDSRSPRSVVFKRHPEKFRELFNSRFSEMYQSGFRLKTSKRDYYFDYRPASESLSGISSGICRNRILLPNTLGIPSQFKPLIQIWSAVIDDLKAFDRVQKKYSGDEVLTADVYEALPVELRNDDHPDFDTWYQIIDKFTDESGMSFIPISELANARGIAERSRLTKKQSQQILTTADCMDLCLEPDSRETGQNYRWDEHVSVFPKEEEESEEDLKSYHAASILLRLGMSIAAADGTVDEEELEMITAHLEQQFNLSPQESVRLEHLALLLSRHPVDDTSLARKLHELPEDQRNVIGDLLVGIASADDIITPDETKALKKAFRNLKLDPDRIDRLTEGVVSVENDSSTETELVLNHDRIREIMAETSKVSEFLHTVMVEDEADEIEPINSSEVIEQEVEQKSDSGTEVRQSDEAEVTVHFESADDSDVDCDGLDARYHAFLKELLSRNHWQLSELETQARTDGLMLMGAIEAINEWSLESLGDWLIEETGDTVQVYTDLINTNKSS